VARRGGAKRLRYHQGRVRLGTSEMPPYIELGKVISKIDAALDAAEAREQS
jgi:hypothetical protein